MRESEITGFASKNAPSQNQRTNSHQPIVRPLKAAERATKDSKNIRNTEAPPTSQPLEIIKKEISDMKKSLQSA